MKVLFLTKYGAKSASTRYRFLQYFPLLSAYGIECESSALFDDSYLTRRFNTGKVGINNIVRSFARRTSAALKAKKYDLLVIHCELYPFIPPTLENFIIRHSMYVYDFDDAIFHGYDHHPNPIIRKLFKNKIHRVISKAAAVSAGSNYLASYASQRNPHVEFIPTAVDLERYSDTESNNKNRDYFVVGWVGSPSTAEYLKLVQNSLNKFCSRTSSKFVVIGSGESNLQISGLEILNWTAETEVEDICKFDVGIMPLSDNPWSKGKCGFKLIQYMACGLPVIAAPVGANLDIVEHGRNGYFASSEDEWIQALDSLHNNADLGRRMGIAGRKLVEEKYCLDVTAPRLASLLQNAAGCS